MAITATFTTTNGTKKWEVSASRIVDLSALSTGYELNSDSNKAVENSPQTNQRGLKKQALSFSSNLHAALGIDVRAEFESWKEWIGLTGILQINGKQFGPNWLLKSVKPSDIKMDDSGRFRSMKLAFSFEESDEELSDDVLAAVSALNSATAVGASDADKEKKKTTNPQIKNATPTTTGSSAIALNDIVQFKGGPHYVSSTAKSHRTEPKAGPAKVTAFVPKAPHPYHIIHTDKTSTVYGWVDADLVSK